MRTVLLLVLLASPSFAYAQDASSLRLPANLYLAAAAADLTSTAHCFQASPWCIEANPVGAAVRDRFGSPAMLASGAALDVATVWAVRRYLAPRHPRLARIALYAGSGLRFTLAARNVALARHLTSCRAPVPMACQ